MLVVAQLDASTFDYCPADIAPLLRIAEHSLRHYCRELWPLRESRSARWRLDFGEACILIRRACIEPKNRPNAAALWQELLAAGKVTADLESSDLIRRALAAISADHAARKHARRTALFGTGAGVGALQVAHS